jgi:hypothetical protein
MLIGSLAATRFNGNKPPPKWWRRRADASCPGGFSDQFHLNGQVQNPARFRLADLQYRPSVHLTVSYFSGNQGLVTKTYEGVALIDLLNDPVIVTDPTH